MADQINMSRIRGVLMEELMLFFMGFLLVMLVVGLVFYIVNALVYVKLSKKCDEKNYWLAWIPFGVYYLSTRIGRLDIKIFIATLITSIVFTATDGTVSLIFGIVLIGLIIYMDRYIFDRFGKNKNLAFFHLIPVLGSFIVFIMIAVIAFGESQPVEWI